MNIPFLEIISNLPLILTLWTLSNVIVGGFSLFVISYAIVKYQCGTYHRWLNVKLLAIAEILLLIYLIGDLQHQNIGGDAAIVANIFYSGYLIYLFKYVVKLSKKLLKDR